MSILRIYFSGNWRDGTTPCPWALCDENGTVLQSGNDTLAAMPKSGECIAVIAPDRVLFLRAKLPPGARRRLQAVLPFLAEEYTLPDPEENHVVPGPMQNDGRMSLAVVDKAWLGRIAETCRTASLHLRRAIPETLLPALAPQTWLLVWDGSSGFLRTGPASGMALDGGDADSAPLALRLSLEAAQSAPPKKIEVRFPQHVAAAQRVLPQWRDLPVELVAGAAWDWQRATIPGDALNLLWGDFAPHARIREWWPRLRPAALILLAALGVEAVGTNVEWAMLANEKRQLARDMERTFHAAFGANSILVNAPLQMQRNLAGLRHATGVPDETDFLPLLDAAAPLLAALPTGSTQALHYETGRLDVDIRLGSKADILQLQQRLQQNGLKVNAGDMHDAGNGVETRLSLQAGDGS